MVEQKKRRPGQFTFGTGERQFTLFQFTPEAKEMLAERGLELPPAPFPVAERRAPTPIRLPGTLEPVERLPTGARTIPASVTSAWRIPVQLRDYQQEALQAFLRAHRGSVYLPPGAGKTLVADAAILALRVPTVVLVPTLVLASQWAKQFREVGIQPGIYTGERKEPSWVTISTYQSLYQYPDTIREFPFIVFDEADLVTGEDFRRLLIEAQQHPYALAMTGTRPKNDERVLALEGSLPVLLRRSLAQIGEAGHVIVPEVHSNAVSLTAVEADEYERAEKSLRSAASTIGQGGPERAAMLLNSPDPDMRTAARRYLAAYQKRQEIVNYARNKGQAVLNVVREHGHERILLFANRVEALDATCFFLTNNGFPCRVISGETPGRAREEILNEWGRTFNVLASAKVLERGFNVPEVAIAVVLASGQSAQQILQRFGRIARPAPGKTRADAFVIYARNTFEDTLPGRMQEVIERGE